MTNVMTFVNDKCPTNVRHLPRGVVVNRICLGPWNAFFLLGVANYGRTFVEQVFRLDSTWTAACPGVYSCFTPNTFSMLVVICLLASPMVKNVDKVWLHFHDLPDGHRQCLHCPWKHFLMLAGRKNILPVTRRGG